MKQLLYVIYFILPAFIIGFVSGYQYLHNKNQYQIGYDKGMCAIVRSITGRPKCEIKEFQTMSGGTIRAAISLPE